MLSPAPEYVLAAFGLAAVPGEILPGARGRGWRYGDTVLLPADDPVVAAWAATVFESLRVSGIRVPRPVRALDGRWVVGGWCAGRFVSGRPAGRYADIVAASAILHEALRGVARPRFLAEQQDRRSRADRLAWGETVDRAGSLGRGRAAELWFELAAERSPIDQPAQIVHGELFGNVLFAGSAPPAIVSFRPLFRPARYADALVVVDAIAWGGASADLAQRWIAVTDWDQLLLRAALARLALTISHPRADPGALVGIMTAAEILRPVFRR